MTAAPIVDEPAVRVSEPQPGLVVISLNRPRARNALNFDSWTGLRTALADIRSRDDTRAVVLTGAGPFFSAGGDLKSPPRAGTRATAPIARLEAAHQTINELRSLPIPAIAAVEGGAVGIAWGLVLACDLIVAAEDARFGAPFITRGIVPDGGVGWFLTERLGRHRAASILLTGKTMSTTEAQALGLVTEVTPPGDARRVATAIAGTIAAGASHAVELTKRLLHSAEETDLASYLAMELTTGTLTQLGPDADRARDTFTRAQTAPETGADR